MDVRTESGATLTEGMLDTLAEQWENDTWEGQLTATTQKRPSPLCRRSPQHGEGALEQVRGELGSTEVARERGAV
jgi:hypothetical protein